MTVGFRIDPLQVEYPVLIRLDRCTDGTFCWVAEHPDLPGCAAHGTGIREAKALLEQARIAYITHLLARDEMPPIPAPHRPAEWQVGYPASPPRLEVTDEVPDNEQPGTVTAA